MAWFKKVRKPMAPADRSSRVPEGLWLKCPECAHIIYNKEHASNLAVCPKCAHHFRLSASDRLKSMFDDDWSEHDATLTSLDPLRFRDTKAYRDRLVQS